MLLYCQFRVDKEFQNGLSMSLEVPYNRSTLEEAMMADTSYAIDRIPWEQPTRPPRFLKQIPNAPSFGRKVSGGEMMKALSQGCKRASVRRNELLGMQAAK